MKRFIVTTIERELRSYDLTIEAKDSDEAEQIALSGQESDRSTSTYVDTEKIIEITDVNEMGEL